MDIAIIPTEEQLEKKPIEMKPDSYNTDDSDKKE